jgi:hypothetical protein
VASPSFKSATAWKRSTSDLDRSSEDAIRIPPITGVGRRVGPWAEEMRARARYAPNGIETIRIASDFVGASRDTLPVMGYVM